MKLRQRIKEATTIMKSLHVECHHDKTWLGRVKNGFDFLGFRITPASIHPSTASVSRRDAKIARLYEQGADRKSIGQYLRRWLGWSSIGFLSMSSAFAYPVANTCAVVSNNPSAIFVVLPDSALRLDFPYSNASSSFITSALVVPDIRYCLTALIPDDDDTYCENLSSTFIIPDGAPFYVNLVNSLTNTRCAYEITLDSSAMTATGMLLLPPAAVPILTPLGLVATISGLLWFGRRRRIKLKTS